MVEYAFYIWIALGVMLFILELLITSGFFLLCFSVGALVTAFVALTGCSAVVNWIVFVLVSLAAFLFIRPVLIRKLDERSARRPKTNVDALIGRKARVVEPIKGSHDAGRVAIDGDNWQAISIDGSAIEQGRQVEVMAINSIVLSVRAIDTSVSES